MPHTPDPSMMTSPLVNVGSDLFGEADLKTMVKQLRQNQLDLYDLISGLSVGGVSVSSGDQVLMYMLGS